jgi:membrane-bound lytic murein transglycosylase F
MLSSLLGMYFMISSGDFLMFYLGLELSALPIAALVAFETTKRVSAEAGIKFIQWLDQQIPEEVTDPQERMKFILAAYNVGLAHVYDARRLAEKYESDPNIWTGSVDSFLRQKSNPKFYRDSVVRYGYCRGEEPYNFVIEIMDRYDHYRNLIRN